MPFFLVSEWASLIACSGARNLKAMTPRSMFLRVRCSLLNRLQVQERVDGEWMLALGTSAATLDVRILDSGWRFMWIVGSCSRWGFGHPESAATQRASAPALKQIGECYNAAELGSAQIRKCPGFRVAKATLHPAVFGSRPSPA